MEELELELELELWLGEEFSLLHDIQIGSGAHPASYPISIKSSFPGCKKQPRHEVDYTPPTRVKVKKTWIYMDTPHAPSWSSTSLIKHKIKFSEI
jgi:hypothetical protein